MTYKERIPGMKPDNRTRNIVIGGCYILLLLFLLANFVTVIGLLIMISPIIIAVIIGRNYKGSADELAGLPGISDGGGIQTGISAFVYTLVFVSVFMGGLTYMMMPSSLIPERTRRPIQRGKLPLRRKLAVM